jgi:uncharacterized tellurite resistance protein B-like protein
LSLCKWYSREAITTKEFIVCRLQFEKSLQKKLITYLEEKIIDAEDAKKAAKELRQKLDTMKRYLFVKNLPHVQLSTTV